MATTEAPPNGIVYFHYKESPYARRVVWYLAFRQIAYAECIQPRILPRPDLAALGVHYRRTPTMAIGRDFYLDTRAIIARLETIFPASDQHPAFSTPETAGLAALLNKLVVDASLFVRVVTTMPLDGPLYTNKAFRQDRAEFFSKEFAKEDRVLRRNEGLVHVRQCFEILESLFVDGRKWVGGTEKVSLADLEGIWTIDWMLQDLQAPKEYFSEEIYPKVFDWRTRFRKELESAKSRAPKPVTLEGPDAVKAVLGANFSDKEKSVDPADPLKLSEGTSVELFPTDSGGLNHKDHGRLVKLTKDEVAIAVQSGEGNTEVHVHAPRWNFRIAEVGGSRL